MTTPQPPAAVELIPVRSTGQITAVAELASEIWHEYYVALIGRAQVDYMVSKFQSVAAITEQITSGYEYFLVERAGRAVGYCAVQTQSDLGTDPSRLFLSKLYVHQDQRGTGTGRACMEFIEQLARRRRLGLIWLTVNKGNPAVQAYERMGFSVTAPLVMDIGGGFVMDDFRMEKRLTGRLEPERH